MPNIAPRLSYLSWWTAVLEQGREVNHGGARYGTAGCQGVGLADVVDSLAAIEDMVFHRTRLSMAEFVAVVHADFEGREELRQFIVNKSPKYGADQAAADQWAEMISGIYTHEVSRLSTRRGGTYLAGFWSMTTHQGFGKRLPALASGRRAGESLANGVSPANGRDRLGPTAALVSAARLDSRLIGNGYALNMKVNLDHLQGNNGERLIGWLVNGYFGMGGCQVQFNILDPDILMEARRYPEKFPDLVVRVSGYSAYFNDLTEAMKDELIARTLHGTSEGCGC